ncbi:MAG: SH3 domain-containing protein [Oscillospiraceae bacterium]
MPIVFLSPSTQEFNNYLTEGNEELYMNMLADRMEPYLRSSGIRYVRNDPDRGAVGAIADSNAGYYDVHLALHTNAGGGEFAGKLRGIDIYYSPDSDDSEHLANIIANNLENIYPLPSRSRALPTYNLGEVLRTKAPAVLAELGYHDNEQDELWIKNNLNAIAKNLVQSLCDYFGIPFIEAGPVRQGMVMVDEYSNLNIRDYPSIEGRIIGSVPNGTMINIYGTFYGEDSPWYVINYNGIVGYVSGDFVAV